MMKNMGSKQSQGDHTLFIKHSNSRGVNVDDIIMMGNDEKERNFKAMLV